jgi:hypothetical protein
MTGKVREPRQPKYDESNEAAGDGGPKHPKRRGERLGFENLIRIIVTYHLAVNLSLMTFMTSGMGVIG